MENVVCFFAPKSLGLEGLTGDVADTRQDSRSEFRNSVHFVPENSQADFRSAFRNSVHFVPGNSPAVHRER